MLTRCYAKIQGSLPIIVVAVCVIEYMKFSWKSTEVKPEITDKSEKLTCPEKVVYTQSPESRSRPYLIPRDESLTKLNESDLMQIYLSYVNTRQILCRNQTRMGSIKDGGKEVCLDNDYKPSKPCVVYSFGSNYYFDFDLDVYYSFGCVVYTFDPSMDIAGKGKGKIIPSVLTIKEVGLSGTDHVSSRSWQMKTLKTIMKENGHQETIIDVLKMDIEGGEWNSIPNILESGAYKQIKQLLVEFHFGHFKSKPENGYWGNLDMVEQLRVLRMLYEYGFRIFMKEGVKANVMEIDGPIRKKITPQYELCFVNIAFLQY